MNYLYHWVPSDMTGTVLYPLNVLKEIHPEIYAKEVEKYKGREILLTMEVPPLKCLWNDVLHFTAVSPQELRGHLAKAGIEMRSQKWYKVPVSLIEGEKSAAFTFLSEGGVVTNLKEYGPFQPSHMDIYRKVPEETIEYYRQKKAEGVRPLLFHLVPHILYKGNLDISQLEIVTS